MFEMYTYKLRPEYGENYLLLEFCKGTEEPTFLTTLLQVFTPLDFKLEAATDLWMNYEILLHISSQAGEFTLTKDIWDFVFILAGNNQNGITILDEYLLKSGQFEKIKVNFDEYKKIKE